LALRYDTDKSILVEYLHHYEEHFKDLVDRDVRLLELGHDYGMVGFVKELVDELGAADIAGNVGAVAQSKFREIRLYHSHLFVIKA
jgi:hypothetical protein